MSNVHAVTTRSTARVEEEGLTLLMLVQNLRQVTVTEDNASAHETMRPVASHLLEALQKCSIDRCGAKLACELLIVDRQELARLIDSAGDIEWCDDLANGLGLGLLVDAQVVERRGLFGRHVVRFDASVVSVNDPVVGVQGEISLYLKVEK